ncbi:hypothetical protein [Halorubrum sp. Atlit-26R]|jgi:hypothetical protein|uniref:DUF7389 domain-containing protein n=1 Tax=Halorubrum sp. Atlit-26R TaxID=2282128 RepID=UPI000EF1E48E|nr:hypothetical protein [Halorubrum sp. Atlit-26R]RLM68485.1 hypothetical protein DVK07_10195 [Halorubrum sp. Atlit-26R]
MADDNDTTDDVEVTKNERVTTGSTMVGKVTRGEDTRDQDTLKIKGRGETMEEAAEDFAEGLEKAEEGNFAERLRALGNETDDEEESDE